MPLGGLHGEGRRPGDGVVHGKGLHPEGPELQGKVGRVVVRPRDSLKPLALGRGEVGEAGEAAQDPVGAAEVAFFAPLQDAVRVEASGAQVDRLPVQAHLGDVLHGLGDGRGGGGGHDGEVPPEVGHGPGVVQVGVGEEEGQGLLPGGEVVPEQVPFQVRGEEGVLPVVPVEAGHRGQEAQVEEVPQPQGGAGGEELGEVGPPPPEGAPEVQEKGPLPVLQEDLVAPDLLPAPKDVEADPS
jgi:hypothetical protein